MMRKRNNAYLRARKRHGSLFPDLFINRSAKRVTQERIDEQGLVLTVDGKRVGELLPTMSKKDVRTVLKNI